VNCLKLSIFLPDGYRPQSVTVHINDEKYGRFNLPTNVLSTPEISLRPVSGRIRLRLMFGYARPLSSTDPRIAAARLTEARLSYDANLLGGTKGLETPESVRELQALYTDIARYALSRERETIPSAVRGGLSDLIWTLSLIGKKGPKGAVRALQAMRYLRRSSFDTVFYALQQKAVHHPNMDPITHYVVFGAKEGLDPAPGFSTRFYLQAHDDIAKTGINPFYHYLKNGMQENRRTEPSDQINLFLQTRNGSAKLRGALRLAGLGNLAHTAEEMAQTWPKRDMPDKPVTTAGDIRPEDDVLDEARKGEAFLKDFALLGRSPKWKDAVESLNRLSRKLPEGQIDVSIIVPVYGQLAYTLNLLDSLLSHESTYRFEILIGDDASPDQSGAWLSRIDGVTHIRYEQNEGFIANCNKTVEKARGHYVVLLNNDTRVCAGWLDGLISTFDLFPNVGLTGSKLLYPDGSLQEAGGIVWRDGSAWNYGRNDDPNRPEYCRARNVDYISGASIALKKDLWDELGGFDTHYSPAYYEDTDLSFRIRARGQAVIMQPSSRVIHYEGKTSGTDTTSGVKAYQTINREKFYVRWQDTLTSHRPNGEQPERERDRAVHKRVLILDAVNPRINQDAGSNATRDLFLYYQALGYGVSFLPEDNFLYEPEYVKPMQAQGIEALYAPYVPSLSALLSARPDYYDVIHLIRPLVAHRNIDTVRRLAPKAKIAYLNADLHYLRMERQSVVENRPALLAEAAAMKAKELALNNAVDITFVHSTYERELLLTEKPDARIYVLPLIDQIVESHALHSERRDVMFLGGYNHPPNLDAARWLLQDIWPQLSERLPQARLLLIGANPPAELKALASDRVVVTGRVDNLSEWFNQSRIFLAPLRYGAGAKGKLIAAMGHGVPVIATDIATEGLGLMPDEAIFIANAPDEFIRKAVRLFRLSAKDWKALSGVGQERVRTHHSFEAGLAVLREALR
ncbi:MAG: glycosyltransferase, partial [Asticcacaulis sp.]